MNRTEFKVKALENIDQLFNKVDEMEQKKELLTEKLKKEYYKQVADLKERKADLVKKLDAVESAPESKFEAAKQAYSETLKRYKTRYNELSKLFK